MTAQPETLGGRILALVGGSIVAVTITFPPIDDQELIAAYPALEQLPRVKLRIGGVMEWSDAAAFLNQTPMRLSTALPCPTITIWTMTHVCRFEATREDDDTYWFDMVALSRHPPRRYPS